jgi:hypothetical protein
MLPLYEAKMLHQFDHRWATYDGAKDSKSDPAARDVTAEEKSDPAFAALPRYWVEEADVRARLGERWDRNWLMGWRDIARSTDERTTIASVLPKVGLGNKVPILATSGRCEGWLLPTILDSISQDFGMRQKAGGSTLNFFIVKQLPAPHPDVLLGRALFAKQPWIEFLRTRVLELTYTAWDMAPFARDLGDDGPPFIWDDERRFLLRAELDAAFFHLYGIPRDDVDYIMDTFPIVKRKDEEKFGSYRTKEMILQIYDEMQEAVRTGKEYQTKLEPPAGDERCCHSQRVSQ